MGNIEKLNHNMTLHVVVTIILMGMLTVLITLHIGSVDARNQVRFDKLEKQNKMIIQMLERSK
jgi:hypothetical protein